jgi:ankyrin repeat protein
LAEQDGVSLTAKDFMGGQPIHKACSGAHREVVKWLLEQAGTDIQARTKKQETALHSESVNKA